MDKDEDKNMTGDLSRQSKRLREAPLKKMQGVFFGCLGVITVDLDVKKENFAAGANS